VLGTIGVKHEHDDEYSNLLIKAYVEICFVEDTVCYLPFIV